MKIKDITKKYKMCTGQFAIFLKAKKKNFSPIEHAKWLFYPIPQKINEETVYLFREKEDNYYLYFNEEKGKIYAVLDMKEWLGKDKNKRDKELINNLKEAGWKETKLF